MKISLNWLKKYVKVPVSDEELIRLIGARLVEVEGVIDETHKYDNIYIVRVESCEKIPETHLSLCKINNGADELTQVVCGAPNVNAGMLAVWIAPGAIVPASVHEDAPFVIGKRKMRGYESSGMLAGADELDFGDDHSGIVEIDPTVAKPGDLLMDVFDLKDKILEIENKSLTHRPDTFGVIGFAREVAGILGESFEEFAGPGTRVLSRAASPRSVDPSGRPLVVASVERASSLPTRLLQRSAMGEARSSSPCQAPEALRKNNECHPQILINNPSICQRYSVVVLEKHGEMRKKYLTWQDTILSKSGMKPINPIVDATNYLMLLTGQPLHAFDYDKFVAVGKLDEPKIVVRLAKKGEKLELLDDTLVELNESDIVICSNETPVALAGAMGGKSTMIDDNTKNIIIESATFSLYNLRKTQMAHGIFSEAITRFTKGQPAYQTLEVAKECAGMLAEGFRMVSIADEYRNVEKSVIVKITISEINDLLGTKYDRELIVRTLENVGFKITNEDTDDLERMTIEAPAWRTDIHIKEDIIEEVGRLLGYDNIEPILPLHATAIKNLMFELKHNIRELMKRLGANEVLTYSFVSAKLLEKVGQDFKNSYKIINSISPELQYIRQSLIPNLLEKTYLNEKIPVDKFAIYEINKVYQKEWGMTSESVPLEKTQMAMVIADRKYNNKTAYYQAKKYVDKLFREFGVEVGYRKLSIKNAWVKPFEPKRTAEIYLTNQPDVIIGVVGEFKNSVKNEFKLADYLAGFEIDVDMLLGKSNLNKRIEVAKKEVRDLTVTTKGTYGELVERICGVLEKEGVNADILPVSVYQADNSDEKNISVRLEFDEIKDGIMERLENL